MEEPTNKSKIIGHNTGVGAYANEVMKGSENTSLGYSSGSAVDGFRNLALGKEAGMTVKGNNNVASGYKAGQTVVGHANIVSGFMTGQKVKGDHNIASGYRARSHTVGNGNLAFGAFAGTVIKVVGNNTVMDENNVIQIDETKKVDGNDNIAIGASAAGDVTGSSNVAMGNAAGTSVVGDANVAFGAFSVGKTTASETVAIGAMTQATVEQAVAIGANSVATCKAGIAGYGAPAESSEVAWVSGAGAVSIGDTTNGDTSKRFTRQITGMAAGTNLTDAVNEAQLKAVDNKFSELGPWKLQANGANERIISKDSVVNFVDGEKTLVTASATGKDIKIDLNVDTKKQLDNAIQYDGSDKSKVTLGGGTEGTKITNLKAGGADTDAVNVKQLKGIATALGGGAGVNNDGSIQAPTYKIGDKTYHNVEAALGGLDTTLTHKGLSFAGDTVVDRKLGEKLTIKGGAPAKEGFSGFNLRTRAEAGGTTQLLMSDNPLFTTLKIGTDAKQVLIDNGTVTNLTNKAWNPADITSGRAATEDQLKALSESIGTIAGESLVAGNNIALGTNNGKTTVSVVDNPQFGSVFVNAGGKETIQGLSNKAWDPKNITSGQVATEDQLQAVDAKVALPVTPLR